MKKCYVLCKYILQKTLCLAILMKSVNKNYKNVQDEINVIISWYLRMMF